MDAEHKTVIIVAAHFLPSNLAAVHRARLWSRYLAEFGWKPVILTTDAAYYEEKLDLDLLRLLPPNVQIIRTKAFRTHSPRIIGDIGLRAFFWHLKAVKALARREKIDFVHITIPSFYSSLLGPLIKRCCHIPFGIDYIDPWVHETANETRWFDRSALAQRLARLLEPVSLRDASLITGINERYYSGALRRNPRVAARVITAAMPYGNSTEDYDALEAAPRRPFLFKEAGTFNMIYAGAMLPRGYALLKKLLEAVVDLRRSNEIFKQRFRLHFVGTGKSPDDPSGFNVQPMADELGLESSVTEHPNRIGYLDVLNHLRHSDAVLIVGSTEPHYSPSKVFQAISSRRPVLAMLHSRSEAACLIDATRAGCVVPFDEERPATLEMIRSALMLVFEGFASAGEPDLSALTCHSARASARVLAAALTEAVLHGSTAVGEKT